jgi:hypothetical protein
MVVLFANVTIYVAGIDFKNTIKIDNKLYSSNLKDIWKHNLKYIYLFLLY